MVRSAPASSKSRNASKSPRLTAACSGVQSLIPFRSTSAPAAMRFAMMRCRSSWRRSMQACRTVYPSSSRNLSAIPLDSIQAIASRVDDPPSTDEVVDAVGKAINELRKVLKISPAASPQHVEDVSVIVDLRVHGEHHTKTQKRPGLRPGRFVGLILDIVEGIRMTSALSRDFQKRLTAQQTWRRPTLPRLKTKYHRRWSVSRPSSGWDRVQPLRHNHQVSREVRRLLFGLSTFLRPSRRRTVTSRHWHPEVAGASAALPEPRRV